MDSNNFFSIDRLIEFGMGMTIAQQMVGTMNESLKSMHIPGEMNKLQNLDNELYYAIIDDSQIGPLNKKELSQLITNKKITKETFVWMPGMASWQKAIDTPQVLKLVALAPPPFTKE